MGNRICIPGDEPSNLDFMKNSDTIKYKKISDDSVSNYELNRARQINTKNVVNMFKNAILKYDYIKATEIIEFSYIFPDIFFDFTFENGDNCLLNAIRNNEFDFASFLLKQGCNPNIRNELTQDTPLHLATKTLNTKMIELLIQNDADIYAKNLLMETPQENIKNEKSFELFRLLTKKIKISNVNSSIKSKHFQFPTSNSLSYLNLLSTESINNSLSIDISSLGGTPTPRTPIPDDFIVESKLRDWLFKLNTSNKLNQYNKRYVFIKDNYLLWNKNFVPVNYNNKLTATEMNQYNGSLSLSLIKEVRTIHKIDDINEEIIHEFEIIIKPFEDDPQPLTLIFKCINASQLNKWFNGLNQHCNI
mmetsp:Transcript_93168/g.114119  ORF Transcript_93168/g.114119 Transcript_93168/m.114119 type:complete len:362 (+) Transcript_93168:59-1144(+)